MIIVKMSDLRIGERATYRGAWGTDAPQPCVITGIGENKGRLVYDCRLDNGAEHWGYADQFRSLEVRK